MKLGELIGAVRISPLEAEVLDNGVLKRIKIPAYGFKELPPNYCSRFVRFLGKDVFGVEYPVSHAWDLRHKGCRTIPTNGKSLVNLYSEGVLVPGDAVGIENPESPYSKHPDMTGQKRVYTHVGAFVGISPQGKDVIADELGFILRLTSEQNLIESGKRIVEVIKPLRA